MTLTLYATGMGLFAAGFALIVLLLYAAATIRRCLPWRLGVHVILVAGTQIALTLLATVTLADVPQVVQTQPWRPAVQAVVFTLLAVGLVLISLHVRQRVTTSCRRGHTDVFHRAPPRA